METTNVKTQEHARLRRIAGQVNGIVRMLAENRGCFEVLQQVAAAQAALVEAGKAIFASELEALIVHATQAKTVRARRKSIANIVDAMARFSSATNGTKAAGARA
jgi:DNA-binding FrmR family transcriptional regulator